MRRPPGETERDAEIIASSGPVALGTSAGTRAAFGIECGLKGGPVMAEVWRPKTLATEWAHYQRIKERLLAEGHEWKWVLIKGEEVVGVYGSVAEANAALLERFPGQLLLLKNIIPNETPYKCGYNRLCLNSPSPSSPTS
jgi:hypothetical protein